MPRPGAFGFDSGDRTANDPATGSLDAPSSLFWDKILPWLGFAAVPGAAAATGAFGAGAGATDAAGSMYAAGGPEAGGAASSAVDASVAGGGTAGASGGSTIGNILKVAQGLSPVLGGAAKGQAAGERANDLFNLDAASLNTTLPSKRLAAALKANLLLKYTPAKINWGGPGSGLKGQIPTMTGGLDFTNLSPETKQLADQVMKDELNQQLAGPIKPTAGTSTADNILGGAATGAGIAGALLPFFTKTAKPTTAMPFGNM